MALNNFRFHRHVLFQLPRKKCLFHDGCCILNSSEVIIHEFLSGHIDITFASNRYFDLPLAEFMTFIILSYEMSVV